MFTPKNRDHGTAGDAEETSFSSIVVSDSGEKSFVLFTAKTKWFMLLKFVFTGDCHARSGRGHEHALEPGDEDGETVFGMSPE